MTEKAEKKKEVVDMQGHVYALTTKLGQGGQGSVWRTSHPKILVKGFHNKDSAAREQWLRQVAWLMRQDLSSLPLAKPVALLQPPRAGYVMELMDGLEPLSHLLEAVAAQQAQGFLATGGLSRRLRLLSRLAATLSQLHGRGLAFGDLSPDNIYISADVEHAEVWLIDCDNISFESQPCRALYTPDYGAPELVRGEADFSTLTDIWSFAVIAYRLLTGNHPLKGDLVNEGEPELEDSALRGQLPWIGDPADNRNATRLGQPLETVTSGPLWALFHQCFGPAMAAPKERPSMATWLEALLAATEHLAACQTCGSSYLLKEDRSCTFCGAPITAEHLVVSELQYIPSPNKAEAPDEWIQTRRFVVLQSGTPLLIRPNIPSEWHSGNLPALARLELTDEGLWIDPTDSILTLQRGQNSVPLTHQQRLKKSQREGAPEWHYLHIGAMDEQHMVWRFRW